MAGHLYNIYGTSFDSEDCLIKGTLVYKFVDLWVF